MPKKKEKIAEYQNENTVALKCAIFQHCMLIGYFPVITGIQVKYIIESFSITLPDLRIPLILLGRRTYLISVTQILQSPTSFDHLLVPATIGDSHGSKYLITPRQN